MKPVRILMALMLVICPGIAMAQDVPAQVAPRVAELDRLFEKHQSSGPAPGLVYGVVAGGRLAHVRGFGVQDLQSRRPVTPHSRFRIASMTKAVTALAILKLRDEGRLSLDAPAETYVPEMRSWRYPTADSPRITVRHLLSHTAGLVTDNPWGDRQQPLPEAEFSAMLRAGVPFSRPPGSAMEYSNFGYALLGRIIANVTGQPYRTYIEEAFLKPLGMASTGFDVEQGPPDRRTIGYRREGGEWRREPPLAHGAFAPMGGLHTTAADYGRFVAWLLSAWPPRDGPETPLMRRSSVRELAQGSGFPLAPHRPGGAGDCRLAAVYGMGMTVASDCDLGLTLGHSGGYPGYGSYVLLLPEQGVGIFAFSNRTYDAPEAQVWDAAATLHEAGALGTGDTTSNPLLVDAYKAVVAIYEAGDATAGGNRLAMNFLMDRSADAWRKELSSLRLKVGRCETGAPLTAVTAMSARFTWSCARGKVEGRFLLAPTPQASIQELKLSAVPDLRTAALAGLAGLLLLAVAAALLWRWRRRSARAARGAATGPAPRASRRSAAEGH